MMAIARPAPQLGEAIADVDCGTGFCLLPLAQAVGPAGTVIGSSQTSRCSNKPVRGQRLIRIAI